MIVVFIGDNFFYKSSLYLEQLFFPWLHDSTYLTSLNQQEASLQWPNCISWAGNAGNTSDPQRTHLAQILIVASHSSSSDLSSIFFQWCPSAGSSVVAIEHVESECQENGEDDQIGDSRMISGTSCSSCCAFAFSHLFGWNGCRFRSYRNREQQWDYY